MTELEKDCLFCKIIRGEIPSYTVFENDDVKAFLDISQVTKGHTLIIPKKHLVNLFDYSQEDAARFLQYIPVVAQAIKKSDPTIKGLNVEVNNGEIAGQVVMHSHIHLILYSSCKQCRSIFRSRLPSSCKRYQKQSIISVIFPLMRYNKDGY